MKFDKLVEIGNLRFIGQEIAHFDLVSKVICETDYLISQLPHVSLAQEKMVIYKISGKIYAGREVLGPKTNLFGESSKLWLDLPARSYGLKQIKIDTYKTLEELINKEGYDFRVLFDGPIFDIFYCEAQ